MNEREIERHTPSDSEVAIVGAGQAGLAMGYLLRQKGIRFVILERADSIGPRGGSALIGFVKDDAQFLAERIEGAGDIERRAHPGGGTAMRRG